MMKVLLGRQKTDLSNLMLVGLSLICIALSGTQVDGAGCGVSSFQCQSGDCLPKSYQCDHEDDCPDGSDEIGCAPVNYSMALLWSTKDSTSKFGILGLLFGDLDVCIEQLQLGQTFNASYYTKESILSSLTWSFDSLEVYYAISNVFFSDQASESIDFGPDFIGRSTHGDIYRLYSPPVSSQVSGLSLDWVSKLLYWSDAGFQRIGLLDASLSGWWRPVVDKNLTSPQDVVVHPNLSYLFWIDIDSSAKIERLDLVSEIREVLVSNDTILSPTKLAIDFKSDRLYWLDSSMATIGSCNLDGSNVSLWQLNLFSTISAFTFYRQYLFLGDRTRGLINAFNASRYQVLIDFPLFSNQQGIIDMATFDQSKQMSIKSPCTISKGGCSHFCIRIDATSSKCQCSMGFFLNSIGTSCVTRPFQDNFLLVSDTGAHQLFQVDVVTGEVRATIVVETFLPTAADYDYVSKSVYWFDSNNKTIRQSNLNSGSTQIFINSLATEITSLAVDTVGRNLYFTYYFTGTIGLISLVTKDLRTILAEPGSRPRVVVLDSDSRSLYWSDCGTRSIEKAQMSNPNVHQSIVTQLDFCVSALAIDFLNKVVYWGDQGGNIESSNLDGSARRLLYTDSSANYTGMTTDDTYLYIADYSMRQLIKLDRATNKIDSLTGYSFIRPYSLILYNSSVPKKTSTYSSTTSTATSATSTATSTATFTNSTTGQFTTPVPTGGVSTTTTIILAVVICGSVVLIAVAVVVGILVAKWIKRRKSGVMHDDYYNSVIPRSNNFSENTHQSNSNGQGEMYTELADLPNHYDNLEIDNMGQDEAVKETTEPRRQSGIDNDYI